MIGIGTWKGAVKTIFFNGPATLTISDTNGQYDITVHLPSDIDIPEYRFYDFSEDGNVLSAKAEISILPGKVIDVGLTFEDELLNGFIKAPLLGKIKINNFRKV